MPLLLAPAEIHAVEIDLSPETMRVIGGGLKMVRRASCRVGPRRLEEALLDAHCLRRLWFAPDGTAIRVCSHR